MSMAMSTKMQRVALLASLLLAYAPERAPAQTTSVICQAGTSWMDNAVGQTPCLIAAFLIGQCLPVPSTAVVLPLSNIPGFVDYYAPPQASALAPTDCACNTVLYSLLAACGACQSQGWTAWANWEQNCPQVYVAGFPAKIPPTTRVPEWAYIDITKQGGNFSLVLAQQIAGEDLPDFGDSGNSSSSASAGTLPTLPTSVALPTVGGSATTPVVFPTPTSGSNHLDGNGSKKSNVGPLVGGLVGGIGGLVLIALAVWFFFHRRKRTAAAASSGYNTGNVGEPPASAVPLNGSGDLEKPVGTPTPGGGGYPGSPTGLEYVDHAQQLGYTDHQSLQTPPPMRPYVRPSLPPLRPPSH
ncbi:hypothetical protein BDW22DRAFT_162018 [Trametopsis cervina]|nr:hypothetical protein BDW22DRAFT_162018 [Trametopsis cervina]